MSQNLSWNLPRFSVFTTVILTISYLRARIIETSSLPTDSSRPLYKQIEIFFGVQAAYFNCEYYKSASSGFRLLGETPAGAITTGTYFIHTPLRCFFFVCFLLTFHFKYSAKQSLQIAFLGQISGPNQLFKIYRFSNEYNFSSEVYTL